MGGQLDTPAVVRIAASWGRDPTLFRATPGERGMWGNRQFTDAEVERCDYLLVLNRAQHRLRVNCPPERVWGIVMEPPNKRYEPLHRGDPAMARLYTNDSRRTGNGVIHAHPCHTWSVARTYDQLRIAEPPPKHRALSWVTSNKAISRGHRRRLEFLERLKQTVPFDLIGRGFAPIADKWDGLAPYRYSIAVENFSNAWYWTEKISDCFLAWTMPLYHGCTEITKFFPPESLIQIDIEDPTTPARIWDVVRSDAWLRNRDAIAHARELVLDRYQLFAFISAEMDAHERSGRASAAHTVTLPSERALPRALSEIRRSMERGLRR